MPRPAGPKPRPRGSAEDSRCRRAMAPATSTNQHFPDHQGWTTTPLVAPGAGGRPNPTRVGPPTKRDVFRGEPQRPGAMAWSPEAFFVSPHRGDDETAGQDRR